MLLFKIKNRFRAYPTRQAVQTTGSTAVIGSMNKPILCTVIVLLWIISLVMYLIWNRYQVQYDYSKGVAVIVDKWDGTVQSFNLKQRDIALGGYKKNSTFENNINSRPQPKEQRILPEIIEGIQNKEP